MIVLDAGGALLLRGVRRRREDRRGQVLQNGAGQLRVPDLPQGRLAAAWCGRGARPASRHLDSHSCSPRCANPWRLQKVDKLDRSYLFDWGRFQQRLFGWGDITLFLMELYQQLSTRKVRDLCTLRLPLRHSGQFIAQWILHQVFHLFAPRA